MQIRFKILLRLLVCVVILSLCIILSLNFYIKNFSDDYLISISDVDKIEDVDCIIVLGCQVKPSGIPSDMLKDRLNRGIDLYKKGVSSKILMSGDHGQKEYDEVNVMKQFAIDNNIPSEDVFMDHAGFSTYESMYRAKEVFDTSKVVIVSQEYHLYRAIYIAKKLGIEAYGVGSDYRTYAGQEYRELREILARCKDAVKVLLNIKPTFLGEKIPVSENGNITND